MTTKTLDTTDTKERLLAAGMHEFAERGFADASIRAICTRAGANAAAVNYHFGDKLRFYAEVLVACHRRASEKRPMPRLADDPAHPEDVLRAWIHWFLERLLVVSRAGPLGNLMAREMFQPTPAFDEVIRRSLMPMYGALTEIVGAVVGRTDPVRVQLSVHSVLGQCLLYKHAEAAMERIHHLAQHGDVPGPDPADRMQDLEGLSRHIAEFSLAGLRHVGGNGDTP